MGSLFAAQILPKQQLYDPALHRFRDLYQAQKTRVRPEYNLTGAPPLCCAFEPDGPTGFGVSAVVRKPTPTLRLQDPSPCDSRCYHVMVFDGDNAAHIRGGTISR